MKKNLVAFFVLMLFGTFQTFASWPIPSYNVTVSSISNFQETQFSRGKRDMNIQVLSKGINSLGTCQATIWVYSLDMQTVYGPYTVSCGETLTVPIDEREWGVVVKSNDEVIVNVWTSVLDSMKPDGKFQNFDCSNAGKQACK